MAFLNQISQVLIKFSLQSLRSLVVTRHRRAGHTTQELGQVAQVLGLLCPGSAVLAGVGWGKTPQGHSPADSQCPFNGTEIEGPGRSSRLWVAAAVLQLEASQLRCRRSARGHFAGLAWDGRGLPLTQKRKGCFAFKGGTSNNFLLSLIPLNLYFLKQELLPKNFVNNTLLI